MRAGDLSRDERGGIAVTKPTAVLLLLAATFFWGGTFAVVKEAVARVGVFVFLAQRFVAAFVLLAVLAAFGRRLPDQATLARGVALGGVLFLVYSLQTVSLRFTSASNAAFLSGLGIVLVPVLAAILLRERTGSGLWAAIGLAAAGLLLLTTGGRWEAAFNRGDLLAVACAVCIAVHLVLSGRFAPRSDVAWLAAVQIGIVALGSLGAAVALGEQVLVWRADLLWPLAFCVLLATVFAFLALTAAQRVLSPTHTAVIVCLEPVFAAAWAGVTTGERLTSSGYAGGGMILAAMLLAEVVVMRCSIRARACRP